MSAQSRDQQPFVWHGYVNMMLYGTVLREPASDKLVNQLADALFQPRHFKYPVATFYRAAVEGLRSDRPLVLHDEWQSEETVRDFLTRLLAALDARRPWPAPPYTLLEPESWSAIDGERLIGRIPTVPRDVEPQIGARFSNAVHGGVSERIIVLRLQTGQLCRLGITSYRDRDVALCSDAEPAEARTAFGRLTGLAVSPSD